jgi:hypothetical protein
MPNQITTTAFNAHKMRGSGERSIPGWKVEDFRCAVCGLTVRSMTPDGGSYIAPKLQVEPPNQRHPKEPCGRRRALVWVDDLRRAPDDQTFAKVWKELFSDSPWDQLGYATAEEMCQNELKVPIRAALGRVTAGELASPLPD